ncbi:hypothetical protein GOODEAATRI_009789, partial [Goodea atripinnis]
PMLEHVRIHPELVTGTKDHELDPTRLTILFFLNRKLFFDPVLDPAAATPPAPVLATPLRDTVLLVLPQPTDLQTAGLRGYDSPFFDTTETLTGRQTQNQMTSTNAHPGGPVREARYAASTPDRAENTASSNSGVGSERVAAAGVESRSSTIEQSWSFQSGFTPIDHHLHRSLSAPDDEIPKFEMFSPSPCTKTVAPVPYESLFALALPRAASLFVGQKTSEAVQKAAVERLLQQEEGLEDGDEEGVVSASPLEVLDRLVQQGSDAHDKVLKR